MLALSIKPHWGHTEGRSGRQAAQNSLSQELCQAESLLHAEQNPVQHTSDCSTYLA